MVIANGKCHDSTDSRLQGLVWLAREVALLVCLQSNAAGWACPAGARPPGETGLKLGRHRLDFGVGLEGLVAHLTAPAGLLVPAERQGRVEDVVAVDPDGPGAELLRQGVGLGDVLGPDPGAEAVGSMSTSSTPRRYIVTKTK